MLTAAGVVRLDRLCPVCPRCRAGLHPLDDRLGVDGFVRPQAQRRLAPAGASWSFDRAAANLKAFCGLTACDNAIRSVCHARGGAMRGWQRDDPAAVAGFRAATGDVEFQTDGAAVNTTGGWREMRLAIFAERGRGTPVAGRHEWEPRGLPPPHARGIQAGVRTGGQLGPSWRRIAGRLGVTDAAAVSVIADGAKRIRAQVAAHLPGSVGVRDISPASEHLRSAARAVLGEGAAGAWVEARRDTLLRRAASGLLAEMDGAEWSGWRGYFESHTDHTGYAGRLAGGRSIGRGMVEGACEQVIGRRLKQTGARWTVRRAERMATVCAVLASGRWELYWTSKA